MLQHSEPLVTLGAIRVGEKQWRFQVWAPRASRVELHVVGPEERTVTMEPTASGYHRTVVDNLETGGRYFYRLNGNERPDPASRFQPDGVHGPSQAVDSSFVWHDGHWPGLPLADYIIYELHVGTFTPNGTFDAIQARLKDLRELGITAVELMPVAQFPGNRNWGYDGVYPFAVHNSYGAPEALRRLVAACHESGLAVILDVVYNHLGPEGNYLAAFGPYFTDRYQTPWGPALNFDGPESDHVRRFFIENALYWITEFHVDALRLDAVHAILDQSPRPFLLELGDEVHAAAGRLGRLCYLMPESAANDARLLRAKEFGGYGLDAQWSDDFHHALHTLLTDERQGYYQDFGRIEQLAKAFRDGFVYAGEYSPFRRRHHGISSKDIAAERFVVCAQNHDQVGNRMLGDRLAANVSFEGLKLAAGIVLLAPFIPLIFMGEEYGETAPFPYFVSHSDVALIEAVRRGRREEFREFQWTGEISDPQDPGTFERAKLNYRLGSQGQHRVLRDFYRELLRLRKQVPSLARLSKETLEARAFGDDKILLVRRWSDDDEVFVVANFSQRASEILLPISAGRWHKLLDSADVLWRGNGGSAPAGFSSQGEATLPVNPTAFVLYGRVTREISPG